MTTYRIGDEEESFITLKAAQQHLSDNVVNEANSALSLWLQWTLPQLTFALLVSIL
jgi:hypothetical protein